MTLSSVSSHVTGARLAFIDAGLEDAATLVAAIPAGVQVVWIDPHEDGMARISRTLQQFGAVAEIHLLGHGAAGAIRLGTVTLNGDNFNQYAASLAQWRTSLTENADLLLYGCDVAAGVAGETLLTRLAGVLEADVTASSDQTGAAALGGNWTLEVASGPIEAAALFAAANPPDFPHLLATLTGTSGSDTLTGTADGDTLTGGSGADILSGGEGDDAFVYNSSYDINGLAESVDGGAGTDTLQLNTTVDLSSATLTNVETLVFGSSTSVTLTATQLMLFSTIRGGNYDNYIYLSSEGTADLTGKSVVSIERIYGSAGNNTILGDETGRTYYGQDGNDTIQGGGGVDTLYGGNGGDTLSAGLGNDLLYGESGDDSLDGGAGSDTLTGGAGTDTLAGGDGDDTFIYSSYTDIEGLAESVNGGAGTDILQITTSSFNSSLATLSNLETLILASSTSPTLTTAQFNMFSAIQGGNYDNYIYLASEGSADLTGKSLTSIERIYGSAGNNTILGDETGRTYYGQDGNDTIQGGGGVDTLYGGNGGDTLSAGLGNDLLYGESGDDSLDGGAGSDTLTGGAGTDTLAGGDGDDTFIYSSYTDIEGLAESVNGGAGTDILQITTSSFNSSLATLSNLETLILASSTSPTLTTAQFNMFSAIQGGNYDNYIYLASEGSADLTGKSLTSIERIYGSSGNNVIITDTLDRQYYGQDGNDVIQGGSGVETLYGGNGSDGLSGAGANDLLYGESGDDSLSGGAGNDTLTGGAGTDTLSGGEGDDTFLYSSGSEIEGLAEAVDGGTGNDVLQVTTSSFNSALATLVNIETLILASSTSPTLTTDQFNMFATIQGGNYDNYLYLATDGSANLIGKTLTSIERIYGSAGINLITGDNTDRQYYGQDGNDTLTGGTGVDTMYGGNGGDTLNGGAANDLLYGESGDDSLDGGAGNDTLNGGAGTDTLVGGDGDDLFVYNSSSEIEGLAETVNGGAGNDTLQVNSSFNSALAMLSNVETLQLGSSSSVTMTPAQLNLFTTIRGGDYSNFLYLASAGQVDLSARSLISIERIYGSSGNDTLTGDNSDLTCYGQDGNDTLQGGSGSDTLDGGNGDDLLTGGAGNDTLTGSYGNDTLTGGAGSDTLTGGYGNDLYLFEVGSGVDVVDNGSSSSSGESNILRFGSGIAWSNLSFNAIGNDLVIGYSGTDTVRLLNWNTSSYARNVQVQISGVSRTIDDIRSGATPSVTLALSGPSSITEGNSGTQSATYTATLSAATTSAVTMNFATSAGSATAASDFVASSGLLTIPAGSTSASFTVSVRGDTLVESDETYTVTLSNPGGGATLGTSFVTTTIANDDAVVVAQPTVTLSAPAAVVEGNSGSRTVTYTVTLSSVATAIVTLDYATSGGTATAGSDFVATSGTLTIPAGSGSGTFTVTILGDATNEANETFTVTLANSRGAILGTSFVTTTVSNDDPATTTTGEVQSSTSYTLPDTVANLTLTGSSVINGTGNALNNVITGNSAVNILRGENGADRLFGNGGEDVLYGGAGNDYLDGGAGADRMVGGLGNDTYIVGSTGDTTTEEADAGSDLVQSAITWTLGANVETLMLTGTAAINGTGNALDNVLIGNGGDNTLDGSGGNDTLNGGSGNDVLFGGLGNDLLDGGAGVDRMIGGGGNDTYTVGSADETVTEGVSAGTDLVQSAVTWTLGANVENLTLTGTRAIYGVGNALNNTLIGNGGDNTLNGEDGDDLLRGGAGHDKLYGGAGNDQLVGGNGEELLSGGAGADQFKYLQAAEGGDTITDFNVSQGDQLVFVSRNFGNIAIGKLDSSRFGFNTTGRAANASQRFVFNTTTGVLKYDADGSGTASAAVIIATLNPVPTLTQSQMLNQMVIVAS
ncbi:MAG: DUF4347 domain-containing protein [Magnetococcales bacterium]|nr:DUF4347 domain-containing protein [Magnetococcales bacterium]